VHSHTNLLKINKILNLVRAIQIQAASLSFSLKHQSMLLKEWQETMLISMMINVRIQQQ
jgi:hypothetical protein